MKEEKVGLIEELKLDTLAVGDILRLSFGRAATGRWIEDIEMEVVENEDKTLKVLARGGPLEWEEDVECVIMPISLGSVLVKPSVRVGKSMDISFFDEGLKEMQLKGRIPVMVFGDREMVFSEVITEYGLEEAKRIVLPILGQRRGVLPPVTSWEVIKPKGMWIDWPGR